MKKHLTDFFKPLILTLLAILVLFMIMALLKSLPEAEQFIIKFIQEFSALIQKNWIVITSICLIGNAISFLYQKKKSTKKEFPKE